MSTRSSGYSSAGAGGDAVQVLTVREEQDAANTIGAQCRDSLAKSGFRPRAAAVQGGVAGRGGAGVGDLETAQVLGTVGGRRAVGVGEQPDRAFGIDGRGRSA